MTHKTTTDCKETIESIGNRTPTVDTSVLFDELELLNNTLENTDSLDQECPNDAKYPLGLLDELNSNLPQAADTLESILDFDESTTSMNDPFFEEFMDLDQLFPELSPVNTLNVGFEVEHALPVVTSDICQSDVVTVDAGECPEEASPCSDIIDVVTVESCAEVPLSSLDKSILDIVLSPEYTVDVVTVDEGSDSSSGVTDLDCHITEPSSEPVADEAEITVVEASDPLTLLTQQLTQPSSFTDMSKPPTSTLTVDLDELLEFSGSLGLAGVVSSCEDDDTESTTGSSEVSVDTKPLAKKQRSCSSEASNQPTKKRRHSVDEVCELDKKTIRRIKNNVASKHARAARKQKEQELFKQEEELEKSNAELRKQLQELELLTTSLRKVLVTKLSGVSCPV